MLLPIGHFKLLQNSQGTGGSQVVTHLKDKFSSYVEKCVFRQKGRIISPLEILREYFLTSKKMKKFSARHMYCSSNPRGKMMLFKKSRDTLGSVVWARVPWKPAQHVVCLSDFQTGSVFEGSVVPGPFVCVFIEVKAWGGEEIDWFFFPLNFWNYFLHSICNWTRAAILISSFLEPYARPKNINWLRMWVLLK